MMANEIATEKLLTQLTTGFVINGRYEITRKLGMGGFATVFKAIDRQIEREVAVKVMNTASIVSDEEVRKHLLERFQREAKLAARVDHPNVMSIFDYGIIDGEDEPFIVMELLEGHDLEVHLFKNGGMDPDHFIPLFVDCLTALGVAHEHGIVHKDLKPANLFLKRPGTRFESLCIVDFGIAHIEQEYRGRLTQEGQIMGTPSYLAPEYSTAQTVSPALDVYQMGLILVEGLMGVAVVDHPEPIAAMFQHIRGELEIPTVLLEGPLSPILARALALDHTARYQNGFEFADALAKVPRGAIPRISKESPRIKFETSGPMPAPVTTGQSALAHDSDPSSHSKVTSSGNVAGEAHAEPMGSKSNSTQFMFGNTSDQFNVVPQTPVTGTPTSTLEDANQAAVEKPKTRLPDQLQRAEADDLDVEFKSSSPAKWIVLALVLVLGGSGAAAFVFMNSKGQVAPPGEETPLSAGLEESGVDLELAGIKQVGVAEQAAEQEVEQEVEPTKAEAAPVQVLLISTPAAAKVMDGTEVLGTTPFMVEFQPEGAQSRDLRLSLDGFDPIDVSVLADHAPQMVHTLKPTVVAREPKARETKRPGRKTKESVIRAVPEPKKKTQPETEKVIMLPDF